MTRIVHGLTLAVALACGVAAALPGSARADAPRRDGPPCVDVCADHAAQLRRSQRSAERRRLVRRALAAEARILSPVPEIAGPTRYVSLLVLGVGY